MVHLIDKDALVAEIEKRKHMCDFHHGEYWDGCYNTMEDLILFLNTLEVKEVDLDSERRKYLTEHFNVYEDGILQSKKSGLPLSTYDIIKVAEHFFELALSVSNKAQKGE